MKVKFNIFGCLILSVASISLAVSCNKEKETPVQPYDPTGKPIVFCTGDKGTKAGTSFLQDNARFVCKMYYHTGTDITETVYNRQDTVITWFKVSGTEGNGLYWNSLYQTPASVDIYGDVDATRFYWKNRHYHSFLALADNNKLLTDTSEGTLNMCDTESYATREGERYYFNTYYVNKKKDGTAYASMAEQPDPILAFTQMRPEQSTVIGNTVNLIFQHQFSLIQVNIKNAEDHSVELANPSSVASIELLGISEVAYVPHQMKKDGTIIPTFAKKVNLSDYTVNQLKENPYGTYFSMFRASSTPANYLTAFEGIATGNLKAIRIKWNEETAGSIQHKVDYVIPDEELIVLEGGKRYIYNIELRRSTLNVLRNKVTEWTSGDTYTAEGEENY